MFKGLGQMASLMRQALQLAGQLKERNEKIDSKRVEWTSGGWMINVEAKGLC